MKNSSTMIVSGHDMYQQAEASRAVELSAYEMQATLTQAKMIEAYGNIALEHALSAPVVATMRATPGFTQAVDTFPEESLFDVIPAPKTSQRQIAGLESLSAGQETAVEKIVSCTQNLVATFSANLSIVPATTKSILAQISAAKVALESINVDDEEVNLLQTTTLREDVLAQVFTTLEDHVSGITAFDNSDLLSDLEKINEENTALTQLVETIGGELGMGLSDGYIVPARKSEQYQTAEGTFKDKGLTKQILTFYLDRAETLVEQVANLGEQRVEFVTALENSAAVIPSEFTSSEAGLGAWDHLAMMTSHTMLATKLIQESIGVALQVVSASATIVAANEPPFETE